MIRRAVASPTDLLAAAVVDRSASVDDALALLHPSPSEGEACGGIAVSSVGAGAVGQQSIEVPPSEADLAHGLAPVSSGARPLQALASDATSRV
jgi:hypothetical protein